MEQQVVLVTGASSGIGRETAILLARTGHIVYGAARRLDKLRELSKYGVIPLVLDVTKDYSCQTALQQILDQQGSLDILINNAGYGSYGAVEDVPLSEAQRQLEVNVFGAIRLTKLVLPLFRSSTGAGLLWSRPLPDGSPAPLAVGTMPANMPWRRSATPCVWRRPDRGLVTIVEPGLVKTPPGGTLPLTI